MSIYRLDDESFDFPSAEVADRFLVFCCNYNKIQ